jgi:hypothetical protein
MPVTGFFLGPQDKGGGHSFKKIRSTPDHTEFFIGDLQRRLGSRLTCVHIAVIKSILHKLASLALIHEICVRLHAQAEPQNPSAPRCHYGARSYNVKLYKLLLCHFAIMSLNTITQFCKVRTQFIGAPKASKGRGAVQLSDY